MLGEMKHSLDIILKFQIKKVSMTVEMILQNEFSNKMMLLNLLQLILCHIHLLIVLLFFLMNPCCMYHESQ